MTRSFVKLWLSQAYVSWWKNKIRVLVHGCSTAPTQYALLYCRSDADDCEQRCTYMMMHNLNWIAYILHRRGNLYPTYAGQNWVSIGLYRALPRCVSKHLMTLTCQHVIGLYIMLMKLLALCTISGMADIIVSTVSLDNSEYKHTHKKKKITL